MPWYVAYKLTFKNIWKKLYVGIVYKNLHAEFYVPTVYNRGDLCFIRSDGHPGKPTDRNGLIDSTTDAGFQW